MLSNTDLFPRMPLPGRAIATGIACYVISLLVAYFLSKVFLLSDASTQAPRELTYMLGAVLFAPIIETAFIAAIDVMTETMPKQEKLLLSVAVMSLLHAVHSYARVIFVVTPFLFFCYAYYYMGTTRKQGYRLSAGVHATHNLLACLFLLTD